MIFGIGVCVCEPCGNVVLCTGILGLFALCSLTSTDKGMAMNGQWNDNDKQSHSHITFTQSLTHSVSQSEHLAFVWIVFAEVKRQKLRHSPQSQSNPLSK